MRINEEKNENESKRNSLPVCEVLDFVRRKKCRFVHQHHHHRRRIGVGYRERRNEDGAHSDPLYYYGVEY